MLETLNSIITSGLFLVSIYSIVRLTLYTIISNHSAYQPTKRRYIRYPKLTVVIPAHNEELGIERTLRSVLAAEYPRDRLQVVVANDGSTDRTSEIVQQFINKYHGSAKIEMRSGPNRGKAEALNQAIKERATGELIMVLDADSTIDNKCLKNSARHFLDKSIAATASNVRVVGNGTIIGLAQKYEYLISHHMKRTHTSLGMEYIIGGVGSTFRREILDKVNYYDSDTMTEDIDLTLKIITMGGETSNRVVFASDSIAYTEPVQTYKSLVKQRFRWRYGRMQTFWKNRKMFFNTDKRYSKLLTWYLMPTTLLYEALIIIEPLIVLWMAWYSVTTGNYLPIISIMTTYIILTLVSIWTGNDKTIANNERWKLTLYSPAVFLLVYIMVTIEYITAFQSIIRWKNIPNSLSNRHTTWTSPERAVR